MPPLEVGPGQSGTPSLQEIQAPRTHTTFWVVIGFTVVAIAMLFAWYQYLHLQMPGVTPSFDTVDDAVEQRAEPLAPQEGVLPIEEYKRRYVAADTIPDTLRIQLYGPSTFAGYDQSGTLTTAEGKLQECPRCSGGETLHVALVRHGMSEEDTPLVVFSLAKQQKEYEEWVRAGGHGMFYSSVITIPLPVVPPKGDFAQSLGHDTWVPMVYYAADGDSSFDSIVYNSVIYGDQLTYIFTDAAIRDGGFSTYVRGWNFVSIHGQTEGANLQKYRNDPIGGFENYRKSYENTIVQLPVFKTAFPNVMPKAFVEPRTSTESVVLEKQKQAKRTVVAIDPIRHREIIEFVSQIKASQRSDIPDLRSFAGTWGERNQSLYTELSTVIASSGNIDTMDNAELDVLLEHMSRLLKERQAILAAHNALPIDEIKRLMEEGSPL